VDKMKIKVVKLTSEMLIRLLRGKAADFSSGFPDDAEMIDLRLDLLSRQVTAIIRSDSFEDVPEGCSIPELRITKTAEPRIVAKPVTIGKPEIAITKKIQPASPSKTTSEWENEFSPEQRKLLSFQVKGDCVVVKPIQFLKEEWEDINEVVRSLGGKWVKGDIISYWEIPTMLPSKES